MAGPPTADQWRFKSGFTPQRLETLERMMRFEDIGRAMVREAKVTPLPIEIGREGELRGCRRPLFRLAIETATFDQLLSGRDGYRARFWQSPEIGDKANRWLIGELIPPMIASLGGSPHEAFITSALSCASATLWFVEDAALGSARLEVEQWEESAQGGSTLSAKARDGRWAPSGTMLEVRGAYMTDSGRERLDPDQTERSMTLHLAGFV